MDQENLDTRSRSILLLITIILSLGFLYYIQEVLMLFIFGGIVAYAVHPAVSFFHHHGIPRIVSVLMALVMLILLLVIGFSYLVPAIASQLEAIVRNVPDWVRTASSWWTELVRDQPFLSGYSVDPEAIVKQVTDATKPVLGVAQSLIGVVTGAMLAIVIAVYAVVNPSEMRESLLRLIPARVRGSVGAITDEMHLRVGGWLRGIVIITATTAVVSFIFYEFVFKLPYALTLALATALFEVVPIIGPIVAGISVSAIAFFQEPLLGLWVLAFITIWRLLTDYMLVPKVMGTQVGLHPLTIIFSVLVMHRLMGVPGMFLAVPVAAIIKILVEQAYIPYLNRNDPKPEPEPEPEQDAV